MYKKKLERLHIGRVAAELKRVALGWLSQAGEAADTD